MKKNGFIAAAIVALLSISALSGCAKREPAGAKPEGASGAAAATFETPEQAVDAFVAALEKGDKAELGRILGPVSGGLLSSGDEVQDRQDHDAFLEMYRAKHELQAGGGNDLALLVGEDGWPLPIPLRREGGRWYFDGPAGEEEILMRRIGGNELHTIDVMRGYVAAQEEYAAAGHDGQPKGIYAQKLRSDPGKQDGLYWEAAEGQPESPAGPFLASAVAEGYGGSEAKSEPYHGYVYRILHSQGPAANGGAKDYMVGGKLKGGFAAIARPDTYGASGVMTFLVNADGVVWQKDLGPNTAQLAGEITQFNPDESWTPIAPEG